MFKLLKNSPLVVFLLVMGTVLMAKVIDISKDSDTRECNQSIKFKQAVTMYHLYDADGNPITESSGKADKVTGATDGHFAGLDSNGNLTDSGSKAADFLTAEADPAFSSSAAYAITSLQILQWIQSYSDVMAGKSNWDGAASHKTTEDAINGLVKVDGAGGYSAVTDGSANWDTAYNNISAMLAAAQGSIFYVTAAGTMGMLPPGDSGYFLKTLGAGTNPLWAAVPPSGHEIETNTTPLTQRAALNFGVEFTVTDNAGTDATDVTLTPTSDYEFDSGDLVAGILTISGLKTVAHVVKDNGDIILADVNYGGANTTINLSTHTVTNTWKVKFAQGVGGSGGGSGDTIAPATNTDSYVPQWDGADSKTLKNGLAVGTAANNLVQLDGDAKLPAIDGSQLTGITGGSGDVTGPTSSVDNQATRFDADTGKIIQTSSLYIDDDGGIRMPDDMATPATPASGTVKLYHQGNDFYKMDDVGDKQILGGEWTLVKRVEIVASGASDHGKTDQVDGAQTSYTFSGLNGDVDRRYKVVGSIIGAAGDGSPIRIHFNSDTTTGNYKGQQFFVYSSTNVSINRTTIAGINIGELTNGISTCFNFEIWAKSGADRILYGNAYSQSAAGIIYLNNNVGKWYNSADNIIQAVLTVGDANGIGIGSYIELWKVSQ